MNDEIVIEQASTECLYRMLDASGRVELLADWVVGDNCEAWLTIEADRAGAGKALDVDLVTVYVSDSLRSNHMEPVIEVVEARTAIDGPVVVPLPVGDRFGFLTVVACTEPSSEGINLRYSLSVRHR